MSEIFDTWRAEIVAELDAARVALATDQAALTAAEGNVVTAKQERRALADAIAKLGPNPTIASSLHWRVVEHEAKLRQVDAAVVAARNGVKTSHAKIKDYEEALEQLDRIAPPASAPEVEDVAA
jgi:septal ring factor EnvC (AmiA/AmiB activator)